MYLKRIVSLILIFSLILSFGISATAAQDSLYAKSLIDISEKGSITIYDYALPEEKALTERGTGEETDYSTYLTSIGATPLEGVSFKAVRVVNETFTNGSGKSFYSDSTDNIELPSVTDVKTSLDNKDNIYSELNTYTFSPTNNKGKTSLSNLPLGIYLIKEIDEPSTVITKVADYLVSVPQTASNNTEWNYDIVTYPKSINGVVLTYDANNGSGLQESEPRLAEHTEPLTKNPFTTSGMFFLGWGDNPTDKVPKYLDMGDFTMPDHDTTIYAIWGYTNSFRYYTQFKYSEPWGLKMSFAMLNPKTGKVIDYTNYDDYGMYILPMHEANTIKKEISEWESGTINSTGQNAVNTQYVRSAEYIDISDCGSLKINFDGNSAKYAYSIFTYDENQEFIERITFSNGKKYNTAKEESFNTNARYIRVMMNNSYGVDYEWKDEDYQRIEIFGTPSLEQVVTKGKKAKNYEVNSFTFNDGSTDNYLTTVYDEDIFTQTLDNDIYIVTYVTYKGRTFWGTVKNRCVEDSIESIINTSQIGLTAYSEAEVKLATAIKSMYDAEMNYYIKNSNVSEYPKGNKVVAKDNVDLDEWESGAMNTLGQNVINTRYVRSKEYIDVSDFDSLKINFNGYVGKAKQYTYSIFTYDENKDFIERITYSDGNNYSVAKEQTISINAQYIRIMLYNAYGVDYEWKDEDYQRISIVGIKNNGIRFSEGSNSTFTHLTSLRAIQPWKLKLQAQPANANYFSYDDYGVITYTDIYNQFDKSKDLTYSDLINNENSIIYSRKDNTCKLESGYITACSDDIYTYRLQQTNIYTCFYYIKDKKCYYSGVKKRNCLDFAQKTIDNKIEGNELSEAAADVAAQMINLYRETYFYRNGKYPTDDYDGDVYYKEDSLYPTHANS